MRHVDCGCTICRVAIATEITEIVTLTAEQYIHILNTGGLEC